jgi:hypothetical protein
MDAGHQLKNVAAIQLDAGHPGGIQAVPEQVHNTFWAEATVTEIPAQFVFPSVLVTDTV